MIPLGMAAAGAALAPDGEGAQGAALGLGAGLLAHGAGASALDRFKRVGSAMSRSPLVAPTAVPKIAGLSFSAQTRDSPFSVSYKVDERDDRHKLERLDGMRRWVPRHTLERAMMGHDNGMTDEQLINRDADRGEFTIPAAGALSGAVLGGMVGNGLRPLGAAGPILGTLAGGVVGGLGGKYLHNVTRDRRGADMKEALRGVHRMPGGPAPIISGQQHATAAEAQPQLLSHSYTE